MNIEIKKLDNGIPVIIEKSENIKSATLGIFVSTGGKNELEGEEGISHFIEHLLFKGTEKRDAKMISEEIDNVGGIINAYTSTERTVYYVQMTSPSLSVGVDVLNDMFMNSTFLDENIEKERNVIIEEIRMYEDIPEDIVHEKNLRFAIDGILGKNIAGTEESLKGIGREKILKYFKERYIPENIVISIAGNLDVEMIYNQLNTGLGKLKRNGVVEREYNGYMKINSGDNRIERDTNQVHICVNSKGISTKSKDKVAMSVISNVLGGNMSSRLFQKIREERGLAYSVYAYQSSFSEGGIFTVYAGTTKEAYEEVIKIIKDELNDIKNNGITEKELQKAKNQFLSMITFGLESSKGRMSRMALSYMIYGYVQSLEEIVNEIENVTLDDIKRVARDVFDEKYISTTALGNI